MKHKVRYKNNNGYLMIEAMVGISIAVVGLLGVLGLVSHSLSLNHAVTDQLIGNYLAAEGIEITKNIIDANIIQKKPWNQGFSDGSFEADYSSLNLDFNSNRSILFDSTTDRYGYETGSPTSFIRTINIELVGSDEIKVNSIVKWTTVGGGQFESDVEDHFFNWR